ncbi:MAG: TCP-1/cpn60 chaperonin family protein [Armatimonadetes bacterium]|nr:TCP-1/cpn60 chaperonin family protein [Armatimonadota bacterium]
MSTNIKQGSNSGEMDERASALVTNANAVAAVAAAVEGTLGPKGLDCMLVDKFGDVTVTNDGATILDKIDTAHPAAKMLIKTARAQEEEIGDGTTTTTILASALITEGAAHVSRGVPVTKVIEGIRLGIREALAYIENNADKSAPTHNGKVLRQVALVAARGHEDIADLIVEAAKLTGNETLSDRGFSLADAIIAKESAENEVFAGVVLDKQRANRQMPRSVENAKVLVIDDALEPPQVEERALSTESGFSRRLALQEEFRQNIQKVIDLGVKFVAVAKAIDPIAEELFTDAGVIAVRRLTSRDLAKLVDLTGARTIMRPGLAKEPAELENFLGTCIRVYEDMRLDHIRVEGSGSGVATVLVGASTREVKDERERIARDAAGAVQSAVQTGIVPGGGSIELAAAKQVLALRENVRGMAAYGVDCVAAALKRPLGRIVANAGFNPLEKVENVVAAQNESGNHALAIDCDTGEIADMAKLGVMDPAGVKLYALRAAAEVAEAILRINVIIRKREEQSS